MTALWVILECDHIRIRDLLDRLVRPAAVCSGSEREAVVEELAAVSSGHRAADELVIWPAVRALCPRGGELAAEGMQQQKQLERALARLRSLPPDDQEFDACAYAVALLARKHSAFEQDRIWSSLGDQLDVATAASLTMRWLSARTLAGRRYRPVPRPPVPVSRQC